MKKFNYLAMTLLVLGYIMFSFSSCKEDPKPVPTVKILSATPDDSGYKIAFTIAATDADTYAWDFGDDAGTSTEMNATYTYTQSGVYTAKVTVTGAGGTAEATKEITIAASKYEMLTGGPALAGGKSWVMSSTDGVTVLEAEDATLQDIDDEIPAGFLSFIGLGTEYEDLFIFLNDGTYNQNPVNDSVVASELYVALKGIGYRATGEAVVLGEFTPGTAMQFTYNETDLTMNVMPDANDPTVTTDVTYTDFPYIEVTGDGFIGILEWPRKYVVFELTTDKLVIGIFAHFPQRDPIDYTNYEPTHVLKVAFVPAPTSTK
jgi:PKD repeat protein